MNEDTNLAKDTKEIINEANESNNRVSIINDQLNEIRVKTHHNNYTQKIILIKNQNCVR